MTTPIVFVDTETTDVGPRRLPWEMAIIRRNPDGARGELRVFIEIDLSDANPIALSVGRFHERHPLGQWIADSSSWPDITDMQLPPGGQPGRVYHYVTQAIAAALWCKWTHGAHVIGAVPSFDTEVMGAVARRHGLTPSHHYHLCDVENLAAGYLMGRLRGCVERGSTEAEVERVKTLCTPPWSSDDLLAEVGVTTPEDERHTALGDARMVEQVWDVIMGDLR